MFEIIQRVMSVESGFHAERAGRPAVNMGGGGTAGHSGDLSVRLRFAEPTSFAAPELYPRVLCYCFLYPIGEEATAGHPSGDSPLGDVVSESDQTRR